MPSCSVCCFVLFCSLPRSFFRLNHVRKVRKRCSRSLFSFSVGNNSGFLFFYQNIALCYVHALRLNRFFYFGVFKCQISACRFLNHQVLGFIVCCFLHMADNCRCIHVYIRGKCCFIIAPKHCIPRLAFRLSAKPPLSLTGFGLIEIAKQSCEQLVSNICSIMTRAIQHLV